jgi:glycosyltransferase involved in cell wall biosynthesis
LIGVSFASIGRSSQPLASRLKILFTSTHLTPFIREDLDLLRRHFAVEHLITKGPLSLFCIPAAVRRANVTLTWFASVYAAVVVFFAHRWGRKAILVVGGVDVAKLPDIGYGVWLSPWKSVLVKYALRHADRVLVVDASLQRMAMLRAAYDGKNIYCVPTGYDAQRWRAAGEKEKFVLTVAKCEDETRLNVKGIPFLLEAAKRLPETRFVVIGVADHLLPHVRRSAPANVELLPLIERDALLAYYQRAKVYCQPSYSEGLPNTLCEAMLCECIPVGTEVGGIPTAMGNIGFLVPHGNVQALAEALVRALDAPQSVGQAGRKHIAEHFTLARREAELLRIVRDVTA